MTRLLAVLFALLIALPAHASPVVDEAGAKALKPRVAAALTAFAANMAGAGMVLKQTGDLLVEPAGTYYAVTTPTLSLKMGDVTRTIGMLAINAIPTDDADVFKVALALPTPMLDTDSKGGNVGSVSIGQQNMSGVWNMKAMAFTDLTGTYKNVVSNNLLTGVKVGIPDMAVTLKLSPDANNTWSGPADITITNYAYEDAVYKYTAGGIHALSHINQLDFLAAQKNKTTADVNASSINFFTKAMNAVDTTITANNLTYQIIGNSVTRGTSGTVANIVLQTALNDIKKPGATATFNAAIDGMTSSDPTLTPYVASHIAVKGSATNVPLAELLMVKPGGSYKPAMIKAGTVVKIDDMTFDSPAVGVEGTANYKLSSVGMFGIVGQINTSLRGLDQLQTFLVRPDAPRLLGLSTIPPFATSAVGIIQMTGKPGVDSKGRPAQTYALVVTPEGKATLNGADLSSLSGALQAQKALSTVTEMPQQPAAPVNPKMPRAPANFKNMTPVQRQQLMTPEIPKVESAPTYKPAPSLAGPSAPTAPTPPAMPH